MYDSILGYLIVQTQAWQLLVHGVVMAIFITGTVICIWLAWRGRPRQGTWLLLTSFWVATVTAATVIEGFGLPLLMISISLTSGIAALTLPHEDTGRAIFIGVVVGLVNLLQDLLLGFTIQQLDVPALPIGASIIGGTLFLSYLVVIGGQFKNYSLRTKLVIAFLAVALIPLAALAYVNNRDTRIVLTDESNQALFGAASQTAASLDRFIETNLNAVRIESLAPILVRYLDLPAQQRPGGLEEVEVMATLRSFRLKDQVYINSYALLDRQGLNVADTSAAGSRRREFDQDYFEIPVQVGLPYMSPVEFSQSDDQAAVIYFSAPVRNPAGEIVGVLRMEYQAAILQQIVVQSSQLARPQAFGVLFDEHFLHLAHGSHPETIYKLTAPLDQPDLDRLKALGRVPNWPAKELTTNLPELRQSLANAASQPFFTAKDAATGDSVNQVAISFMERQPWLVAFFEPQEVFLAPVKAQTRNVLLFAIPVTILVGTAALGLGQVLTRPLVHLNQVAQQVAAGQFDMQAPVNSQDEIGQLAETFNRMNHRLRQLIDSLEEQVRERTAELALSMEVGQRALAIRDLDDLMPIITEFIRERFDLYYVQIYLLDDIEQNVVLRAGTGPTGEELLAQNHTLPIDANSIVGAVAIQAKAVAVVNTETSAVYNPHPLLPDTRSELAAPLIVENRVIGVLDMQASQVGTFTDANLTVFEAMATQLAISIDSAQQWAAAQDAQHKLEAVVGRLTRENWADKLALQQSNLGYVYNLSSVKALEANGAGIISDQDGISVPVMVQNESIGRLYVEKSADQTWTEEEQAILTGIAKQIAQKAETLRLFEAAQVRATREQVTRQITEKIQASRDIESALKTAAEELNRVLGTDRALIDLKVTSADEDQVDE
jgi:GAF domain-containing protein